MLLKEENKGLKIIKFVVIGFVLVFAGVLTLSLFPPMIFLILAGLSLYNIIREKNKSEQLRRVCTYAVNARISNIKLHEGMDPFNNYNTISKRIAVYDFMFNGQYFQSKSRDHFYNSGNVQIGSYMTIYTNPNNPLEIYEPEQEAIRLKRGRSIYILIMVIGIVTAIAVTALMLK